MSDQTPAAILLWQRITIESSTTAFVIRHSALFRHSYFVIRHFSSRGCTCVVLSLSLPSASFLRWLKDEPRQTKGPNTV
jgi:hypothetical protein